MRIRKAEFNRIRRFSAILLCFVMSLELVLPITSCAQGTPKTVRVGWYESPFNMMDARGRRSGYAYEYQQKIAADRVKDDPEKACGFYELS